MEITIEIPDEKVDTLFMAIEKLVYGHNYPNCPNSMGDMDMKRALEKFHAEVYKKMRRH